jgi:hypothetical protein
MIHITGELTVLLFAHRSEAQFQSHHRDWTLHELPIASPAPPL